MELIQRARFSPLLYFGVLAFGLMGFARIRMRCVCVCVHVHYATFGRGESFVKGWLPCSVCGILISLIRKNFYRLD